MNEVEATIDADLLWNGHSHGMEMWRERVAVRHG